MAASYKKQKVTRDIHVVVIGGGTSGLEAACTAAEVGCRVTLIEREGEVGGLARKIARFPEKSRIEDFPAYLEHRAAQLPNLTIKLNTTATKEMLLNSSRTSSMPPQVPNRCCRLSKACAN